MLETEGWAALDAAEPGGLRGAAGGPAARRRHAAPPRAIIRGSRRSSRRSPTAARVCNAITSWENRWYQRNLVDQHPDGVSARAKATLAKAEAMTPGRLSRRPARARRRHSVATRRWRRSPTRSITLSCPGPAPLWSGDVPGQPLAPRPTGDFVFNAPSSMLFAPAVTMPLMSVGGMPVGVQLMGQQHEDARVTAIARWMLHAITPVCVSA